MTFACLRGGKRGLEQWPHGPHTQPVRTDRTATCPPLWFLRPPWPGNRLGEVGMALLNVALTQPTQAALEHLDLWVPWGIRNAVLLMNPVNIYCYLPVNI